MSSCKKTDDKSNCPVCQERMTSPRMLFPICQHVYCLSCLARMVGTSLEKDKALTVPDGAPVIIKCPQCQKPFEIKLVSDIEHSIHHDDDNNESSETTKPIPKCVCIDAEDVMYDCINCGKQYCKGCFKKKDAYNCKELQHCIAEVADGGKFLCFEHKIDLKYYCLKCQHPICVDCFLKDHRGHENKTITEKGKDLRRNVMQCKSIADGNNKDLEDLEKDAENLKGNLKENFIDYLERSQDNIHGIVSYLFDKAKENALGQIEARKAKIDLDLRELGHQLNADQTTAEINDLHDILKEIEDNDLKILKFEGQISGRLDSCNEQERKVKSVQCRFGNIRKQKGLFEISMNDIFNSIRNWFPHLQVNYATEPQSFYQDYFKRKYSASLTTEQTEKESDKDARTTRLGETDAQSSQGAKEEKPGQAAAAKNQASIVTDGKQSSTSPNKQDIIYVGMRSPNTSSSGGFLPHTPPRTPPHTRLGRKDTERAWSTITLSELPNEDSVSQEQRSKSSYEIDKVERFSSQDNAAWQAPQSSRGIGATIRKATSFSFSDMREQRTPPAIYSQPRLPLNSSTSPSPPHQLRSHQPRVSPPYQPSFHHSRSSPTSPPFVRYLAPQEPHSAMTLATFNAAPASGGRGQRRKEVTIKDPSQGGKDVTDEILRRTYPNRK